MQQSNAQKQAVCHVTGPMLVLAGPGSGKTFTITERVKHLVTDMQIKPENIMVVTFAKAAAVEMRERYLLSGAPKGVLFGTFHSIFFSILKHAYGYSVSDVVTADEQRQFVQRMTGSSDEVNNILGEISKVKSEQYNINEYYPVSCAIDLFRDIYISYEKWLKQNRKIDFDDMINYTYELFDARKDILSAYQERYKYILVDEFQDINYAQYRVLKQLAAKYRNLFVVGDDDQSIYGFRESKPELMLNFKNEYPDAKEVLLNINYRCASDIVESAKKLILHNKVRFEKEISAGGKVEGCIEVNEFADLKMQNNYVVDMIKKYHDTGNAYADFAILYRTNVQPQALLHKLLEYNIPVRLKDGIPNIYEHWIAKDICAYIRLGMGFRDRATFERVMNKPTRYISRAALDNKEISFQKLAALYDDKYWMTDRIFQFEDDVKALYKMAPCRGMRYIDKVVGYGDYLKEYAAEHGIDPDNLREIYEQLYEDASNFSNYEDWFAYMENYDDCLEDNKTDDAVTLMTMHSSKGLEFENVIIVDVNEEIMPYKKAVKDEEIEEERRLFYVAVTRAKKRLHLLYVKHRYNHDFEPSRFLEEMEIIHHRP